MHIFSAAAANAAKYFVVFFVELQSYFMEHFNTQLAFPLEKWFYFYY